MLLDEKARDLQDTLVRQYLRNPRMSRSVESQLWHAVTACTGKSHAVYDTFVLHLISTRPRRTHMNADPAHYPAGDPAFGHLLKWRSIRYLPAGEKLWLRLHNLYRIAESEGFHRQTRDAYTDDEPRVAAKPPTCIS